MFQPPPPTPPPPLNAGYVLAISRKDIPSPSPHIEVFHSLSNAHNRMINYVSSYYYAVEEQISEKMAYWRFGSTEDNLIGNIWLSRVDMMDACGYEKVEEQPQQAGLGGKMKGLKNRSDGEIDNVVSAIENAGSRNDDV